MNRIKNAFSNKAKIAYLTVGSIANSEEYFQALIAGGVNLLEIGIPFSDPVADGPVIQTAMKNAIDLGTNIDAVFLLVKKIRASNNEVAIILFTYLNPIVNDLERFILQAKDAGIDGVLVVDMPFEESYEYKHLCDLHGLSPIFVAAPTTSLTRIRLLSTNGSGFLYYACRSGVTGVKDELPADLIARIRQVKQSSVLPVAVGFGISTNKMVKNVLQVADGVVVGSYFVQKINENKTPEELKDLAREVFDA